MWLLVIGFGIGFLWLLSQKAAATPAAEKPAAATPEPKYGIGGIIRDKNQVHSGSTFKSYHKFSVAPVDQAGKLIGQRLSVSYNNPVAYGHDYAYWVNYFGL